MRQDMIRQMFSREEGVEGGRKPLHPVVVWLIIGAILFLAVSSFWSGGEKGKTESPRENAEEGADLDDYLQTLEQRLTETLEKISGAGTVSVFINMEDGGERVLAADRTKISQEDMEDAASASRTEEESHVILWEQDGAETPYIVKERFPEPAGVLVVAEGAGNETVRQEIYEAVRALFGLPAHRIKITN